MSAAHEMHGLGLDDIACVKRADGNVAHSALCPVSDGKGACSEPERLLQRARDRWIAEPLPAGSAEHDLTVVAASKRRRQLRLVVELRASGDAPRVDVMAPMGGLWAPIGRLQVRPETPCSTSAVVTVLSATVPHSDPYLAPGGSLACALREIGEAALRVMYAAEIAADKH